RTFVAGIAQLSAEHPTVKFTVENMFPLRSVGREFVPYAPGWDPTLVGFSAYTLDLSHCAASRSDALAMADTMGDALAHIHLGDGVGKGRDEHLVPGRGTQPCAELLASLAERGLAGGVGGEGGPRGAGSGAGRGGGRAEPRAFARQHLGSVLGTPSGK